MSEEKRLALFALGMGPRPAPPTGPGAVVPPTDLRAIPRAGWPRYESLPVLVPPGVQRYIDGLDAAPTADERDSMEDAVCAFHGILPFSEPSEPWTVSMTGVEFYLQKKVP